MIFIRFGKPINQSRTKQSAFLSFNYDLYLLDNVKAIPTRYWVPNIKQWEIPTNYVKLVSKFSEVKFLNEPEESLGSNINEELFKTKPLQHQIEGVEHGLNNYSWLLGDQQGLGKTKQIIDLAVQKKHNEGLKHCLIICGINNLKYNWAEEIKKHSNESFCILGKRFVKSNKEPSTINKIEDLKNNPEEFFWITNIESLRCTKQGRLWKSEFVELINNYISKGELSLIAVDEVHKAKNPKSAQGRGLLKLNGCPKIGMSGTLLVNKPLDLFMPLKLIDATMMNAFQFQNRYLIKGNWGAIIGYQNMKELQTIMDCHMLRRTKKLLDLPSKIHKEEIIEMSADERKLYNQILEETKSECDLINKPSEVLAKLIRLRQICCHTGLVSSTVVKSTKFERLRDILEEARDNNEKVIVFSSFRKLIELALEEFKEYNPLHIWGQMSQEELDYNKTTFQESTNMEVLFGVIQAAGTGITLNQASIVVFLDLPWNRATMEQAEDRAHRIGTKNNVTVISLLMKNTYDEILHKMIISKKNLGDILVDGADIGQFRKFLNVLFKEKGLEDEY